MEYLTVDDFESFLEYEGEADAFQNFHVRGTEPQVFVEDFLNFYELLEDDFVEETHMIEQVFDARVSFQVLQM